mgnify:CR=1 FL=1
MRTKQRGLMPKRTRSDEQMNEAIADGLAARLPLILLALAVLIAIAHAAITTLWN